MTQYERSLKILENFLGPSHVEVAETLRNIALIHKKKNEYDHAEPLYERWAIFSSLRIHF